MKIIKDKETLKKEISGLKNLSFVPTMGSFHLGHKYLIKKAKKKKGNVIVSIFINPKQFNSKKDFKKYPRNLKKDLKELKKLNVNYVYLPTFKDIFNFKTINSIYLDNFNKKLCGKFRKIHFKGVLDAVNRFLEIIKPNYICLGLKDYQQLYLIQRHIIKNEINTKIIKCKTIREKEGFAFSSRNKRLSNKDRNIASKVIKLIKKEKRKLKNKNLKEFKTNLILKKIKKIGVKKIDYINLINIINPKKMPVKGKFNIFIAYYVSEIRLIDNV